MKTKNETKILLVEPDPNLATFVKAYFENSGLSILLATNNDEGMRIFLKETLSSCIIDINAGFKNNFSLAKELKKLNPAIPMIFISSKSGIEDKIKAFQAGCDDFIIKPFEIEELLMRVIAVQRRANKGIDNSLSERTVVFSKYKYNYYKRAIMWDDGKFIKLTSRENELFNILLNSQNQ